MLINLFINFWLSYCKVTRVLLGSNIKLKRNFSMNSTFILSLQFFIDRDRLFIQQKSIC